MTPGHSTGPETAPDGNLFRCAPSAEGTEVSLDLFRGHDVRIESIVSRGSVAPVEGWYDQEWDEWVAVIRGEAELEFADGSRCRMSQGDYVLLPRGRRHRVVRTSADPPCVWLAVHCGHFPP